MSGSDAVFILVANGRYIAFHLLVYFEEVYAPDSGMTDRESHDDSPYRPVRCDWL